MIMLSTNNILGLALVLPGDRGRGGRGGGSGAAAELHQDEGVPGEKKQKPH